MALEKLTIIEPYTMPHMKPEVAHIEIDFAIGESSLAGDETMVEDLKWQAKYMPKEPCQSAFREDSPAVANWTAQPFNNRDDFKVLLFSINRCIEGDEKIEWVDCDEPEEHFIYEEGAFDDSMQRVRRAIAEEEDRDKNLMVAQNPPPYNVKKP